MTSSRSHSPQNLVLLGMPGSGKSTLGKMVAASLGWSFVDTDQLIEEHHNKSLQEVLDELGYLGLREEEERCLMQLQGRDQVISTGGSAVYSARAMEHLGSLGVRVYLALPLQEIEMRVNNFERRGIACRPSQTLADLFDERCPLYESYADQILPCEGLETEELTQRLWQSVQPTNQSG